MRVFCVNGQRESGKTTFEQFCFALNPIYVRSYSSIDFIKQIARGIGWDGTKGDKDRKFLGDLKQLLIEYNDLPFKDVNNYIVRQIQWAANRDLDFDKLIFFIDVREPEEIEKLRRAHKAQTILLKRGNNKESLSKGDNTEDILNYQYDYIIENSGNLEDLKRAAYEFMDTNGLILGTKKDA